MSSNYGPPGDNKVNVKIVSTNPSDDLLTRNFSAPQDYSEFLHTKHRTDKRISSKLLVNNEGLVLAKGSWWVQGPSNSLLPYKNILRFSPILNHPKRILVFVTNENSKIVVIVIKTKSENFANYLLKILQKNVIEARQREVKAPRPVSYLTDVNKASTTPRKTSTDSFSTSSQKRRPAPAPPFENKSESPVRLQAEKVIIPKMPDGQVMAPPPRTKKNSILSNGHNGEDYTRINVEKLDSEIYYSENADKRNKSPTDRSKQRKTKSRPPRELSTLGGGRKTTREYDENNTPWEVNLCYIKHDPLVGCVEDESGPIYMYTAHQLFVRDDRDYNDYDSEDSDEDTLTDGNESDNGSSTNSQGSLDENKELERFLMLDRKTHTNNKTNGKMTEVYEY